MNNTNSDAESFNTDVPNFSEKDVLALIDRYYNKAGTLKTLSSERDQNFRFDSDCGARFVVKISNPSEDVEVIDFQVKAIDHLADKSVEAIVPKVIKSVNGRHFEAITLPNGAKSTIRIMTYLDGIQVKDSTHSAEQRRVLGSKLAELDLALVGINHPQATHSLVWNVSAAHKLAWMMDDIEPGEDKRLAEMFMTRYTTHVLPHLDTLRKQVIHNDYHLYNVLVDPANPTTLTGIIDFGDMLYAPLVGEVATAAAFHMIDSEDPFAKAAEFVAAYHEKLPLTALEQEVITDLVITRQLITVIISQWRAKRFPENRAYIMRHNQGAWDALKNAARIPRDIARDKLLKHC